MHSRDEVEAYARKLEEICRLYYIYERTQKQIFSKETHLHLNNSSAVSLALKKAVELGVIFFDVDSSFAIVGDEENHLSRQIRDTFRLAYSTVVNVGVPRPAGDDTGDDRVNPNEDDYLHTVLANHTGKYIGGHIESEDHIAVAGGRAVYQTVRVIRRGRHPCRDIEITPLSGRIWTHSWEVHGPYIERPIDADDAAFVLALAFEKEPGTKFSQVAHPLFAANSSEATAIIEEFCPFLANGAWRDKDQPPRRAIVGIGVIDPKSGHRCSDLFRNPKKIDPYLHRAAGQLRKAVELVEKERLPYFGDVANRFFPALYLPSELKPETLQVAAAAYAKLNKELAKLTDRMIVVDWGHLKGIPSVDAVAGGPLKLRALWTLLITGLLEPDKRIIDGLTTDTESAEGLIAAHRDYEHADPAIRQWYADIVRTLFK
ncbi:MAG TPA: hypothetical protein VFZ44_13665 [Pyrinomonadaceae bacterium]